MSVFKGHWRNVLNNLDVYLPIGGGFAGAVIAFIWGIQG
jgi:hypothetical protein